MLFGDGVGYCVAHKIYSFGGVVVSRYCVVYAFRVAVRIYQADYFQLALLGFFDRNVVVLNVRNKNGVRQRSCWKRLK